MLAKCANLSCSAMFHHLDEGRLFRLETDPTLRALDGRAPEFFWLCKDCSAGMTLSMTEDGKVIATGLRGAPRNDPQVAFVSVKRENGLLLGSVSFGRRGASDEAHGEPVDETAMPLDGEQHDDVVAAASSCPVPECSSLVIEYRAAGSVRPGHSVDWGFTCPRCGVEFTVAQGELIFQSVPKQWLQASAQ